MSIQLDKILDVGVASNALFDLSDSDGVYIENTDDSKVWVSIVTARGAHAHERVITILKKARITVNESFFLGVWQRPKYLLN